MIFINPGIYISVQNKSQTRQSTLEIDIHWSKTSILLILIGVCLMPNYILLLYFNIPSDGQR